MENSEIPPTGVTGVGGWFKSGLQTLVTEFLESHQRKLVDCSDPASETMRPSANKSQSSFMGPATWTHRLDLNHPPTSVGGIRRFRKPTSVGWI